MKRKLCFIICIALLFSCILGNDNMSINAVAKTKTDTTYYQDYERAFWKGYLDNSYKKKSKKKKLTSSEYRSMLRTVIKNQGGSLKTFDKKVKKTDRKLTRGEAIIMSYYAAVAMKAAFRDYDSNSVFMKDDFWIAPKDSVLKKQFPSVLKKKKTKDAYGNVWDSEFVAAYLWNAMNSSVHSGIPVIAFDSSKSMQTKKAFTMEEAVCAVTRICDGLHADKKKYVSLTNKKAITPTLSLKKKAKIKDINNLPRLTGFVLNAFESEEVICQKPEDIANIANWGFSSARLNIHYRMLFNEAADKVDLYQLEKLDELVAAAEHYGIHLNILMYQIPGRLSGCDENYNSYGEFDLFINPEKQKTAQNIWRLIAARYKDVPGDNLSFTPLFEPNSKNLSTGLPAPDYTRQDVYNTLSDIIEVMRKADKDCFITYELLAYSDEDNLLENAKADYSAISGKYKNTMASYNYSDTAFIYFNMTAAEGENVDTNNHSMFLPDYPNLIYSACDHFCDDEPITIDGFLPKGTTFSLYLKRANGKCRISSDKKTLYEKEYDNAQYKTSYQLSGYYPYATSDHNISFTLDEDTAYITLSCTNGNIEWSGLDITLPKEYAQEKWYGISTYDQYLAGDTDAYKTKHEKRSTSNIMICPNDYTAGKKITVTKDLTYTSEKLAASARPENTEAWATQIKNATPNCTVRYEMGVFSIGVTQEALCKYYDSFLTVFDKHNISWYSNDYELILKDSTWKMPNAKTQKYGKYENFNKELLQVLQKHK